MAEYQIFKEVADFYRIIPLQPLRRTPGGVFDNLPMTALERIDAIDRVLHQGSAVSPGPVAEVLRPWYMHPHQADNLIVLFGTRQVDIYLPKYGMESFTVTPEKIYQGDTLLLDAPAMLVWP